ncbi:protein of unknown function [Micromonospora phaseoli]|uniref:DUF305 domain-containing protein n=1 Tax=Micromonospora phaseoli TaxID=1144548 RepID=A0A1H7C5M5_9ACTN|nr:DUF305 domain-containing protein [Micromonospora phaseoli]PZV92602.1 protein of unknown function (DUF305) [Micromonospora phaseoli]GIJ81111.1 hypothetical protein Xph01_55430 [Micromonospora phaseoli]SEJ84594.1 protein of unknown function [Micromonospora phaseoli]
MRVSVAVPSTLLIAVLLAAGCSAGSPQVAGPSPASAPPPVAPTSEAVPPQGSSGPFGATDIAWLQLTVAMAERLLPVLDLVPARTTDRAWRRLAARVEASHRADLARSHRLLGVSGAPATNPHEGHDMPGMVTEDELATLRSATGKTFHRLLAGHLRAHLSQSVRIAAAAQRGGIHPATTALAAAVVRGGTTELARLDRLDRPPIATPTAGIAAEPADRDAQAA